MRRLPLLLAALLPACTGAAPACWTPADATPGWKAAVVPAGAPALAAPPDIEQFRPGEPALAWADDQFPQPGWTASGGVAGFSVDLAGGGWDAVELTFSAGLGGQEIEAVAQTAKGRSVILPRTRSRATTVRLELSDPRTISVSLIAHHHLRATPALLSWRAGRWQRPPGRAGTLVYRQPLGAPLRLCQTPGRPLSFHPSWLPPSGAPRPVALTRTLPDRLHGLTGW